MHRLDPQDLASVRPLFDSPLSTLVGESLIAGHTLGTAWTDTPATPRLAVLHCGRSLFVSGHPRAAGPGEIRRLLADATTAMGGTFKLLSTPDDGRWDDIDIFSHTEASNVPRRIFTGLDGERSAGAGSVPAGTELRPIDGALLAGARSHVDALRNEILGGWASLEAFLAHGFGYARVTPAAVLCWCTAEYRSPGRCGIGIETVAGYGGRGYATTVATAFVEHAVRRRLSPHWDCWVDNTPSLRVAQKVGFVDAFDYRVSVGRFRAG